MAFDINIGEMQTTLSDLGIITWENDLTRLNASNMNQIGASIESIAKVLYDPSAESISLTGQVDRLKRILLNGTNTTIDYNLRGHYEQVGDINQTLFGHRTARNYGYQLRDLHNEVVEEQIAADEASYNLLKTYLHINQARGNFRENDDATYGGVIDRMYWEHKNVHAPLAQSISDHTSIFKSGKAYTAVALEATEHNSDPLWTPISGSDSTYGIEAPVGVNSIFNFLWKTDNGINIQDAFVISREGNLTPKSSNNLLSIGSDNYRFNAAYINTVTTSTLKAANVEVSTKITPTTTSVQLGDSENEFANAHSKNVTISNNLTTKNAQVSDKLTSKEIEATDVTVTNELTTKDFSAVDVVVSGSVLPSKTDDNIPLGSSDAKFGALHIKDIYSDNIITETIDTTVASVEELLPDNENASSTNIGADTNPFTNIYAKNVTANDKLVAKDTTTTTLLIKTSATPESSTSTTIGTSAKPFYSIYAGIINSSGLILDNNIVPQTNNSTATLGTSGIPFDTAYANTGHFTTVNVTNGNFNSMNASNVTVETAVLPKTSDAVQLGSNAYKFLKLWTNNIFASDTIETGNLEVGNSVDVVEGISIGNTLVVGKEDDVNRNTASNTVSAAVYGPLWADSLGTYRMQVINNILPADNVTEATIGSASSQFKHIYSQNIAISGNANTDSLQVTNNAIIGRTLTVNGSMIAAEDITCNKKISATTLEATKDILPNASGDGVNIGSSTNRFNYIYAKNLNITDLVASGNIQANQLQIFNDVSVGGTLTVRGNIVASQQTISAEKLSAATLEATSSILPNASGESVDIGAEANRFYNGFFERISTTTAVVNNLTTTQTATLKSLTADEIHLNSVLILDGGTATDVM